MWLYCVIRRTYEVFDFIVTHSIFTEIKANVYNKLKYYMRLRMDVKNFCIELCSHSRGGRVEVQ